MRGETHRLHMLELLWLKSSLNSCSTHLSKGLSLSIETVCIFLGQSRASFQFESEEYYEYFYNC